MLSWEERVRGKEEIYDIRYVGGGGIFKVCFKGNGRFLFNFKVGEFMFDKDILFLG